MFVLHVSSTYKLDDSSTYKVDVVRYYTTICCQPLSTIPHVCIAFSSTYKQDVVRYYTTINVWNSEIMFVLLISSTYKLSMGNISDTSNFGDISDNLGLILMQI